MRRPTIALVGTEVLSEELRPRVLHGFRVLAETVGLSVVDGPADVTVGYGTAGDLSVEPTLTVRNSKVPAPIPQMVATAHGEQLPAFHPSPTGQIDPIAEVFEWSSGLHELSVDERDAYGKIPTRHTLPFHAGLDPKVAWANRVSDDFARQVLTMYPALEGALPRRGRACVAISHDLDFYRRGWKDDLNRIARGSLAAARRRDWATVGRIASLVVKHRHRVGSEFETIEDLLELDAAHDVEPTWVVIPRRAHFRDANYELGDITELLDRLRGEVDIAVHGSYTSLLPPSKLEEEYGHLRDLGLEITGGRQHWLRFDGVELFRALERVDATWDSSVAFSDCVGFRNGFATPFHMYDPFARRTLEVLQVPLVLMDMAIDEVWRAGGDWLGDSKAVLAELEHIRGAAVSVLWHDTVFNGTQTSPAIVDFYRHILEQGYRWSSLSRLANEWLDRSELVEERWVA